MNYRFLLTLTLLTLSLLQCGLPSPVDVGSNALQKPTVSIYNDDANLYLTVSGNYHEIYHPYFEGFNIYVGDNIEPTDIKKRVLYLEQDYALPSKDSNPAGGDGSLNVNIQLAGKLEYRFTATAKESDLLEAGVVDTTLLISKNYDPFETYYFIAAPVQNGKEGSASDVHAHTIVDYTTRKTIAYGQKLNGTTEFKDIVFSNNNGPYLVLPNEVTAYSIGYQTGLYTHNDFPTIGYGSVTYPLAVSNMYYLRSPNDVYLKLYVDNVGASDIEVSYGYRKKVDTDLDEK